MMMRLLKTHAVLILVVVMAAAGLQSCARGVWGGKAYTTYPGLEIELSSTSGVGGLTSAHLLNGDGYVYRWRAMERPESLGDPLGRAEPILMDSIAVLVADPGLLAEGVEATGGMVRTLRVKKGDREQRWSWVAGLSGTGTPDAIGEIADLLREIIRQAESGGAPE
jgi:hypothetical protein